MAIISSDFDESGMIECALCQDVIKIKEATVGPICDDSQLFTCQDHHLNNSELVKNWTDFYLQQQILVNEGEYVGAIG